MENDLNKLWSQHITEHSYAHPSGFLEDLDYAEVESKIVGTWRWGNIYADVYRAPDDSLTGVSYMDTSGEGEIDADGMNVEFYPVEAKEITTVEYVRVK